MSAKKKLPQEEIKNLYLQGRSMTEIAKEFHCAISLIFYILKKHKVPRQNHRKLNFQSVANKYLSGKSILLIIGMIFKLLAMARFVFASVCASMP